MGELEPEDSLGEILFGLIMVLTFTLGASVAAGEDEDWARTLIIGAIGCNIAWGVIDAVFYLMAELFTRSRRARLHRALKAAGTETAGLAVIRHELDPQLETVSRVDDREVFYRGIYDVLKDADPRPTRHPPLGPDRGAGGFRPGGRDGNSGGGPLLLRPRSLGRAPHIELRAGRAAVPGRLSLGRLDRRQSWLVACGLTAIGLVLVGIAIALGG